MWSPVPDLYKGPKVFWSFALGVLDTEQTLKKKKCIYCYELLFAITIFLCILVCILIMCAFTVNDNEVENF